jgi:hypothetical protein
MLNTVMAKEHSRDLLGEAERARLAGSARPARRRAQATASRRRAPMAALAKLTAR